jgi:hypothetical protein
MNTFLVVTGSQGVYLSTTEGDDVIGGGDAVIDGGMKSSMRGGGTFPLKMRQACWWRRRRLDTTSLEDEPSWKLGAAALPKILIHPLLVLDHDGGGFGELLSRSPVHAGGRDRETTAAARRDKNPSSIRYVLAWPIGYLYRPIQLDLVS